MGRREMWPIDAVYEPVFVGVANQSDGVLSAVNVAPACVVLCDGSIAFVSEVSHWLMQEEPRFLHILRRTSEGDSKMHLTFLRLHSRQLCVPFLTLLCFAELCASIFVLALKPRACTTEICSVVLAAGKWPVYHGGWRTLHALSRTCVLSCQTLRVVATEPKCADKAPNDGPNHSGEAGRNAHEFAYGSTNSQEPYLKGKQRHFE
jgi:hypothetical protein